ncbi:MAG: RdgB/HAM1 family non-canonical purine NTP pyrophosphatase [Acidiferrobacterales bacterium]|nr:RdgB/HAM1 family non-canonical purine NTP pyrophosphatase [Acidiferrobacterales bacterium]
MMDKMETSKVVLATGNPGKLKEIKRILVGWQVAAQSEFDIDSVEETGLSFVENAILKARHASQHTGLPALADDSGLEVDVLNGQPGIYSARFAGEQATDAENIEKLLSLLSNRSNRKARFRCVMVYMRHELDPSPVICSGVWEGQIAVTPVGENGFGYDPVFLPKAMNRSAAELSKEEKNRVSHRGQALQLLKQSLGH